MGSCLPAARALTTAEIQAYFERIGYAAGLVTGEESLVQLHRAHLFAVPFENLDLYRADREVRLDLHHLYRKVVENRRGGFCYELNALFAWLLESLGFGVTLASARVHSDRGGFGPAHDHLALLVEAEGRWLADVGFGESFVEPLRLETDLEQVQTAGRFRVVEVDGGWRYDSWHEAGWRGEYLLDPAPRHLADFEPMCHHHATSPESHFTRGRMCSLARPWGRITLRDDRVIRTRDGGREEIPVDGEAGFRWWLAREFGIAD